MIETSLTALAVPILVVLGCIFVIMKSAGFAITAISDYARKTGLSEYLIGFIVVSVGTSLPELSTAFFASTTGHGALILGDVIGANIVDVTVVLGLTAIIGRKIKIEGKTISKTLLTIFGIAVLPIFLGADGVLSRIDGIVMVIAFLYYIGNMLHVEGKFGHIKKDVAWKDIWKDMLVFLGCLMALLLAARWMVISSVIIAEQIHVPIYLVGLIFISIGTTVPELTVEIKSVLHGMSGLALGDLMGSVVVNTSLVLGFAAILRPIELELAGFLTAALFMIVCISLAIVFLRKKSITWKHGVFLLSIYVIYVITMIVQTIITK
ncbi:sodium:calcium antiporter [Thermoproteota archaeon]